MKFAIQNCVEQNKQNKKLTAFTRLMYSKCVAKTESNVKTLFNRIASNQDTSETVVLLELKNYNITRSSRGKTMQICLSQVLT